MQLTLEISGPDGLGSSESVALSSFLASRCRELLGTAGSTEYAQTWKEKTTPLGRSYWEHTALVRRTSDSDSGGWATPRSTEAGHGTGNPARAHDHRSRLEDQVYLAGWPTPKRADAQHQYSEDAAQRARDRVPEGRTHPTMHSLATHAMMAGWPTPTCPSEGGLQADPEAARERLASGRRMLDDAAVGWPTPKQADGEIARTREGAMSELERRATVSHDLNSAAHMAGWPTPNATDAHRGGTQPTEGQRGRNLNAWAALSGWPTPMGTDATKAPTQFRNGAISLPQLAKMHGWPTPAARDHKSEHGPGHDARMAESRGKPLSRQVKGWATPTATDPIQGSLPARGSDTGIPLSQQVATTARKGALAPAFSLWLMAYPEEWLTSAPHSDDWLRWQVLTAPLSSALRAIALGLSVPWATPSSRRSRLPS